MDLLRMILKYILSNNQLEKGNPIDYPNYHQTNIVLTFEDKDGLINEKTYAYIKTHNSIEKVKINQDDNCYYCELPSYVTHQTFFKLKVIIFIDEKHKMVTNEVIVPVRVNDYLDYNRGIAHSFSKQKSKDKAIYDEYMDRYDGLWKYPIIPKRVKNV